MNTHILLSRRFAIIDFPIGKSAFQPSFVIDHTMKKFVVVGKAIALVPIPQSTIHQFNLEITFQLFPFIA